MQADRLFSAAHPERFSVAMLTLHHTVSPSQDGPSTMLTTDNGPTLPTKSPIIGSDRTTRRLPCSTCASIPTASFSDPHSLSLVLWLSLEAGGECVDSGFLSQATVWSGQGMIHGSNSLPSAVHPRTSPCADSTSHHENPSAQSGPSRTLTPAPGSICPM